MKQNDNFKVNKSVLNYIHARDFFSKEDVEKYGSAINSLKFEPKKYGMEIPDFNMIFPEIDLLWGKMLGDFISIDEDESGVFRKPYKNIIHFEDFNSLNEWRFAVAINNNEFNTYRHKSGVQNAIEKYEDLDYFNPDEWERETNITMKPNDAIFYRPWVFHSFDNGLMQCYKILVE